MRLGMALRVVLAAVAVAAVVAAGVPVQAIDGRGKYDVFGSGSVRCNQWERSRQLKDSTSDRDAQWVAGYITAYNRWVHKGRSIMPDSDPEALFAMVDRFCGENPLDTLSGAVESLVLDLKGR